MEKSDFIQLTRREVYQAMCTFEEELVVDTPETELEDITEQLFGHLSKLEGTQMICKPTLDLFDTMSSFEVMDPKMDMRMHRKLVPNLKAAKENKVLLLKDDLTVNHRIALYEEVLVQFSTW